MRKHIIFIIITAVLCCYTASSQEIKYNNFNKQYVIIRTQKGNISLRPFSNTIMEVTWHDDGIIVNDSSVAVTAKPVKNDFVFYDEDGYLRYQSPKMEVCISKDLQKLTFLTHNDTILVEEEGFFKTEDRNGIRFFINKDESFYGSGERAVDLALPLVRIDSRRFDPALYLLKLRRCEAFPSNERLPSYEVFRDLVDLSL